MAVELNRHHIGFVEAAQRVKLKLAAYPFQKYGMLEGTLRAIAPDVSNATTQGPKSPGWPTSGSRRWRRSIRSHCNHAGSRSCPTRECRWWQRSGRENER